MGIKIKRNFKSRNKPCRNKMVFTRTYSGSCIYHLQL